MIATQKNVYVHIPALKIASFVLFEAHREIFLFLRKLFFIKKVLKFELYGNVDMRNSWKIAVRVKTKSSQKGEVKMALNNRKGQT